MIKYCVKPPSIIFLFLFMATNCFSQAGVERGADDVFAPPMNVYYNTAVSWLSKAGNDAQTNSNVQLELYTNCLSSIENVYRIEGNYSGALDLLTGDVVDNSSPALQFIKPRYAQNMQGIINTLKEKKINTDVLQAGLYHNLCAIYTQTGNLHLSLQYQIKCRNILQHAGVSAATEYLKANMYLAKEYLLNDDEDSAIAMRNFMESKISSNKDSALNISYLDLKASILQYNKKFQEAIVLYEKIFNQLKQYQQKHRYYYEMALQLGRLYMQTKQYDKADSVFKRNFDKLFQLQYKSEIFQQTGESLCENMIYSKKYKEASDQLIAIARWMFYEVSINAVGMSEEDLTFYTPCLENFFNMLYTIMNHYTVPDKKFISDVLAMELQWKSRAYINSYKLSQASMTYWDADMPEPYVGVRSHTKHLIWQQYSLPANKRNMNVDSLKEIWNQLERKISKQGSDNYYELKIRSSDIGTQPGTLNIEFIRYNYLSNNSIDSALYAAIVFEQSYNQAIFVPLCSEKDILKLLTNENGKPKDANDLSYTLYDSKNKEALTLYYLIWQPIERYIRNPDAVNYSPVGLLHNISFNAIYNGKTYLLNTCKLHRFLSLLDAGIRNQQYSAPTEIHMWGNMNYDESAYSNKSLKPKFESDTTSTQTKGAGTEPFPNFSINETDTLKKIFKHFNIPFQTCEYGYATEDSLVHATMRINGVLQISTHGFYTTFNKAKMNEPLPGNFIAGIAEPQFRCGLVFSGANYYWKGNVPKKNMADGILTADEIERLQLYKTQLVALSACETGLGDVTNTEGNLGVYRAFKLAGTHYVLASLWSVPAKKTSELFALFYRNWLNGEPLDDALRDAELAIQKQPKSSPYQWGDFILIE